jgi:co-chaperonin GroES (HSP10)
MYSKYTGTEFEDADADVTYIVVKEADVLATLS